MSDSADLAVQHLEAFRQSMAELKALQRAQAMALRRVLLTWVNEIEIEWRVNPTTKECRERLS